MGDERLSDLMVIAVEKEYANKIDLDKAVDRFSKQKVEGFDRELELKVRDLGPKYRYGQSMLAYLCYFIVLIFFLTDFQCNP
ncbi:hypothetical protein QTP88_022100 [Uroleucon formosanum]